MLIAAGVGETKPFRKRSEKSDGEVGGGNMEGSMAMNGKRRNDDNMRYPCTNSYDG